MTAGPLTPIPVIVCGEPARGDDAAGFAAIPLLSPATLERARVERVGQLDVLLLLDLPEGTPCVVVDAVRGIEPGSVWVRPLASLVDGVGRAAAGRPEPSSSHELPIVQALALAATLRSAPPSGWFVGIGASAFGLGAPLGPAVEAALPAFAAAIDDAVAGLAAGVVPGDPAATA